VEGTWLKIGFDMAKEFGLLGLIFFMIIAGMWFFFFKDRQKRQTRHLIDVTAILQQYKENLSQTLSQYKDEVSQIRHLYENNVRLVEDYSRMYNRQELLFKETLDIISLNTQCQTRLVEKITNNMFCPMIREKGPTG